MAVTRVRIEAEGPTMDLVLEDLNQTFGLLFGSRTMPRDSEFVEEVVESHIRNDGAIEYRGRRVMRFIEGGYGEDPAEVVTGNPPDLPTSWVISGNATTSPTFGGSAIWNAGINAASSVSITPDVTWQIRDSCGTVIDPTTSVTQAYGTYIQPFYFNPSPGIGG